MPNIAKEIAPMTSLQSDARRRPISKMETIPVRSIVAAKINETGFMGLPKKYKARFSGGTIPPIREQQ
jgi:hypothetical protein